MDNHTGRAFGLRHLVEASRGITTHLELDKALYQIVGTLTTEFGAAYAQVWTVETGDKCHDCEFREDCLDGDQCLHLKAWQGPKGGTDPDRDRVPVGVLKLDTIAMSLSPFLVIDSAAGSPFINDPAWLREHGVRSLAVFPLLRNDRLMGVLAYYGYDPLEPELGDILSCFAHYGTMAIEDAFHYESLQSSESRYKALLDGAIDAVLIMAPDGRILDANRSACTQFGYTNEEILRLHMADLDQASDEAVSLRFGEMLAGSVLTYETSFLTKAGEFVQVEVRAGRIEYDDGDAVQAFVRDISERKKAEALKADLISMITHDLKSPLSIILGYSEVIRDQYWDGLPVFVKEGVEAIQNGGTKLLSMVEDYLSLSKMEAGVLVMHKYPTELKTVLNRAMDSVLLKAEQKALSVHMDCPDGLPRVNVDQKHLERAVSNLLVNAAAYTPRGGLINVACRLHEKDTVAVISVEDNGMGIPKDDLPRIFDKYYRSKNTSGKGTGLGLAIVKAFVEGHGGTVQVESEMGVGTKFTLRVPVG
ncbi:MAG: PAS domain S-box protein [Nitrospirae bacterium]|nr:PAS domain S-box protein [Nitrospirota bacterium]